MFDLLLRLYPPAFRERFGDEMREAYRAQKKARRKCGRGALLALRVRTILGMARGAWAEWRRAWAMGRGGEVMGTTGTTGIRGTTGTIGRPEAWTRELRQAARRLWRARGFTTVAVATLALGAGAFTSVFTVTESVLLEPLPYTESEELAWVWRDYPWMDLSRVQIGSKEVEYLRDEESVEAVVVTRSSRTTLAGLERTHPRDVRVISASPDVLDVLGVRPLLGRGFRTEDGEPGTPPVVLLHHDLWRDAFGGDPGVVGRTVTLGGEPAEVIGVLPSDFDFLMHTSVGDPIAGDLYAAFQTDLDSQPPAAGWLAALVRFPGGPESPAARAALQRVGERFTDEVIGAGTDRSVRLWAAPLKADLVGDLRAPLTAILGAAGLLLLVLGANLATLFLSRGSTREQDLAVRAALGGSRGAVARSVLAEGAIVALMGAAAAVLVARLGTDLLAGAAEALPRGSEIALDATGVVVAVGITMLLDLLASLAPTLKARQAAPAQALREASGSGDSRRRSRARDGLVVAQVALSLVLLVGGGLLTRSMAELLRVDPGFDAEGTLTFRVGLDGDRYDDARYDAFERGLRDRLARLPNVESVGVTNALPLGLEANQARPTFVAAPGNAGPGSDEPPLTDLVVAGPGYVEAAGLRLLDGRAFREGDGGDGPRVALIDDVLAARFYPDGSAVGSSMVMGGGDTTTIVGVVDQPRFYDVRADDRGQVYLPWATSPRSGVRVAVRVSGGDPMALVPAARAAVAELDPGVAVSEVRTLEEIVDAALGPERLNLGLVAAFALAALLLAGLGIYGVASTTVIRRRPEIGVRMALGAEADRMVRMVLVSGLEVVLVGVVLGLLAAWLISRSMAALLYGVEPRDPVTFAAVAVILTAVGALAAWLPARRATRVDPAETLRAG